jgi:hypothetical protein
MPTSFIESIAALNIGVHQTGAGVKAARSAAVQNHITANQNGRVLFGSLSAFTGKDQSDNLLFSMMFAKDDSALAPIS